MSKSTSYNNPGGDMEEILLKYLRGELSEEEKALIQQQMEDTEFEKDALEGLAAIKDPDAVPGYITQINQKVSQQLQKKNQKRKKPALPSLAWIYLSIFILLALLVLAYIIIHFLSRH